MWWKIRWLNRCFGSWCWNLDNRKRKKARLFLTDLESQTHSSQQPQGWFFSSKISVDSFLFVEEVWIWACKKNSFFPWNCNRIVIARHCRKVLLLLTYIGAQTLSSPQLRSWFFASKPQFKAFYFWWLMRIKTKRFYFLRWSPNID